MKNAFIFFSLYLTIFNVYAQTSTQTEISYQYLSIIINIAEYRYESSGSYTPYTPTSPYGFTGDAMAVMQARYDYNHARVSKEYFKLKRLELVNSSNKSYLEYYKSQTLSNIENAAKTVDLTNSNNAAKLLKYICTIYDYAPLRSEINLLNAVHIEVVRLRAQDGDSFHESKRYKEMRTVLDKLASCKPEEITKLAWDYGLI